MDHFDYRDEILSGEAVALTRVAATHGTPCYVYSRATIERHYQVFDRALASLPHLICYAVKANGNLGVLNLLARCGSGFDIVSGGELERVLKAGGEAARTVFSGVGKRREEMASALASGIGCFNVESRAELLRLNEVAVEAGRSAPVSLRVNPDVDAQTHPYIATGLKENKFGIDVAQAEAVYLEARAMPGIRITGIDCHIGSQLTRLAPFEDALRRLLALVDRLGEAGIDLQHIDIGGGLGIRYHDEQTASPADYVAALKPQLAPRGLQVVLEPGRAIMGNAGVLLTRVEYLKTGPDKRFAVVDAAMTELLRPTLYNAWHDIVPVVRRAGADTLTYDVVGPVCESGDWLGRDRALALREGDLLAVRSAGAYGFSMSSNYNARPRPPEVLVDGDHMHLLREREALDDLWRGERVPALVRGAAT